MLSRLPKVTGILYAGTSFVNPGLSALGAVIFPLTASLSPLLLRDMGAEWSGAGEGMARPFQGAPCAAGEGTPLRKLLYKLMMFCTMKFT